MWEGLGEDDEEEEEEESEPAKWDGLRRGRDPEGYMKGMLWTAQLFADGVCPDFEWHYKMAFAPSAQQLASYLEAPGRASELAPPRSRAPPLPAPVVCAVMLPRADALRLAPPPLATQLREGGSLCFVTPIAAASADDAGAATDAATVNAANAASAASATGAAIDDAPAAAAVAPPPPPPPPPSIDRGKLLAAVDELPAEVLARSGKLTLSPAWLAFSSSAGGAPRRAAAGRAPADPLPLPTLPPEPPAGMRPS